MWLMEGLRDTTDLSSGTISYLKFMFVVLPPHSVDLMPRAAWLKAKDGSQSSCIPFLPSCKTLEQSTLHPISQLLTL